MAFILQERLKRIFFFGEIVIYFLKFLMRKVKKIVQAHMQIHIASRDQKGLDDQTVAD